MACFSPRDCRSARSPQLQPASTERALANCGDAVIGSGQFWAHIVLPDQGAYGTRGRLLIFNGKRERPSRCCSPTSSPPTPSSLPSSSPSRSRRSRAPTEPSSPHRYPEALGSWGYVDRIKLTLKRKYSFKGKELSYFNSACPAPKGVKRIVFPLAAGELRLRRRALAYDQSRKGLRGEGMRLERRQGGSDEKDSCGADLACDPPPRS